jgi:hypothetical protein
MATTCNGGLCVALLIILSHVDVGFTSTISATPIGKVLELMNELLTESEKAKTEEAVKFAKFSQWCKDQGSTKSDEISQDKDIIEKEKAEIEKAAVEIAKADARIKELDADVARWTKDKKAARDVRGKEKADFAATVTDYAQSLEALDNAIDILGKQDYTRSQAKLLQEALIQVRTVQNRHRSAPAMPAELKATLTALAQESSASSDKDGLSDSAVSSLAESTRELAEMNAEDDASDKGSAAPVGKAAGYDFQSGGVLDLLRQLKDKFTDQKTNLEKEELNAQNAYEQIVQGLADNIEGAESEINAKKTYLAKTEQAKAESEGEKEATEKELAEDSKYLEDMESMCQVKHNDFESRSELRDEEIASLKKAIEVIGSDKVKGFAKSVADDSLLQLRRRATSFANLRSDPQNPLQGRIAAFLADRANSLGSSLLRHVAQRVQADPFKKVKKLVKDLIVKLMEEATAEMEHKGWCDTELTTNQQTRDKRSEEIDSLTSEIEDLTGDVAKLAQDISELLGEVKDLDKAMLDASKERSESKATNQKSIEGAKSAITAVGEAISVLKAFYAKSAEATAFAQAKMKAPEDDAPETFDTPFKGSQTEGGSVLGFLEVILSDFSRLESETTSSEATEEQQYKKFMFESAKDRALKANQISLEEATKVDKETALHTSKGDLKEAQSALDQALKYYEKLKPSCVDTGISYSERVQRRQAEIQSLQEALKILSDEP